MELDASPAHLLVKIESFSLLDKCGVDVYKTKEFVAGNYRWRLLIYLNWHGTEEAGDFVSVYLAISNTDSLPKNWEVNAVFSIFIHDQIYDRFVHTRKKTARFFALQTKCGFAHFMSKADLTSPRNGYMIDDSCMIGAEVFVNDVNKVVTERFSLNDEIFPCKHAIKISDFSTLKNAWQSERFTAGGFQWRIALDLQENSVETESSLRVYLMYVSALDDRDERVRARFAFCLKNQLLGSDMNCKINDAGWFDAYNLTWSCGFPFLKISELNYADSGFVVNDTLLLEVEITVQAVAQ